ncbi:TIGR02281 family clan AA aspartic protease [uncultured Sphingomonas sp.]|uniref:retropepsin-like aspartic protease family protein n=1 Tax=uncultured Sphingomonas sp. TaxID=158754 RepID=UPI0025DA52C1|nr:TIGR02281 family clan AA aspartic protease [uncultured Sphingomonas sp.]
MSTDRAMDIVFYGLILILPLSALLARRIPIRQTMRMALIWIGIFGAMFLIIAQRDRLTGWWPSSKVSDGTARIPIGPDGHYWADVRINGIERRMMIDSGATTTALSVATARAAGLDLTQSPFGSLIDTANGPVTADHVTVTKLGIGSIVLDDVGADVSPAFGNQDIIGMNVLSRLRSWRVEQGVLTLNPPD